MSYGGHMAGYGTGISPAPPFGIQQLMHQIAPGVQPMLPGAFGGNQGLQQQRTNLVTDQNAQQATQFGRQAYPMQANYNLAQQTADAQQGRESQDMLLNQRGQNQQFQHAQYGQAMNALQMLMSLMSG